MQDKASKGRDRTIYSDETVYKFLNVNKAYVDTSTSPLFKHKIRFVKKDFGSIYIVKREDGKYAVFDKEFNTILDFDYKDILRFNNSTWLVKKNFNWGLLDNDLKVIIPFEYDDILPLDYNGTLFIAMKGKTKYLYDKQGTKLKDLGEICFKTELINDRIYLYTKMDHKYGLIDQEGSELLSLKYDEILKTNENYFKIKMGHKYGLIDSVGREILALDFDKIELKNSKYFIVSKDVKEGVRSIRGKIIVPTKYNKVQILAKEPLLVIASEKNRKHLFTNYKMIDIRGEEYRRITKDWVLYEQLNLKGLINVSTGEIIPADYKHINYVEIFGTDGNVFVVEKNGMDGVIDLHGKLLIPTIYDEIKRANNTPFGKYLIVMKNNLWGVINWKNEIIIPYKYDKITQIVNDSYIIFSKMNKFGILDIDNKVVVPNTYDNIYHKSNNLIYLKKNEKIGIFDMIKKITIQSKYDDLVSTTKSGVYQFIHEGKRGLVNSIGILENTLCDKIIWKYKDLRMAVKDEKKGIFNLEGELILDFRYDKIEKFTTLKRYKPIPLSRIQYDMKWGFITGDAQTIVLPKYDVLKLYVEGRARVKLNNLWGFIDIDGNEKIPLIYEDAKAFKEGKAKVKYKGEEFYINLNGVRL